MLKEGTVIERVDKQWRTQDFRMGGVEVPQVPTGGEWRVYPCPHWGKGLGRELCPLPRKFFVFFCGKYYILTLSNTFIS